MFRSKKLNNIHKSASKIVCKDYVSTFEPLLVKTSQNNCVYTPKKATNIWYQDF